MRFSHSGAYLLLIKGIWNRRDLNQGVRVSFEEQEGRRVDEVKDLVGGNDGELKKWRINTALEIRDGKLELMLQ